MVRRDDPLRRPKVVSRGAARWVRAELGRELLAVGQFDHDALELLVVHRLSARVEHANAPGDRLLALELIGQHAEGSGLAGLAAADHVAFEEELLAGVLRAGGGRPCETGEGQRENGQISWNSHGPPRLQLTLSLHCTEEYSGRRWRTMTIWWSTLPRFSRDKAARSLPNVIPGG